MIKNLKSAILNLPRRGRHNVAKILCLGFGLAIGAVLIAQVYFQESYDTFFPEADRTYQIYEEYTIDSEHDEGEKTSGGVAQGVKSYCPQVEAATRSTQVLGDALFAVDNGRKISLNAYLADSCFFDVFPQKIGQGKAKETLSRPFYCLVSHEVAGRIGGNVVGRHLTCKEYPGLTFTIGGVFDDFPYNSSLHGTDLVIALGSIGKMMYDGSERWVGNDRYRSYVRLAQGKTPADLRPNIEKMLREKIPQKELKKAGVTMDYDLKLLNDIYTGDPYVKIMSRILLLLAFVLLFSSVMNYLLIVIGNMVGRTREMAVRKCFGAGRTDIGSIVFCEAVVHIACAVVLAGLLIFVCKGTIEQLTATPACALLLNRGGLFLLLVLAAMLLLGGVLPGFLYSAVPVATAFHGYAESRRKWKLALLAFQFAAASLLLCLLLTIARQYAFMVGFNPGYDYDNLAVLTIDGATVQQKEKCIADLRKKAYVAAISSADALFINGQPGNNVTLPSDDRELFNAADLNNVSDGFTDLMGLKVVQGRKFTEQTDSLREVMVSRSFVEAMKKTAHWNDNVVGKRVCISGHSGDANVPFTICGVYADVRLHSFSNPDERPSVMFYNRRPAAHLLIKLNDMTEADMTDIMNKATMMFPDNKVSLHSYASMLANLYHAQQSFRTAVLVGGMVTLIIALLGLIGYTTDEVNRRRKEIAVRKVNGARLRDILKLFVGNISWVAVPSLVIGGIGAYIVSAGWIEQFSERVTLNPLLFVGCIALIWATIISVVVFNSLKVAQGNPVDYLKDE